MTRDKGDVSDGGDDGGVVAPLCGDSIRPNDLATLDLGEMNRPPDSVMINLLQVW